MYAIDPKIPLLQFPSYLTLYAWKRKNNGLGCIIRVAHTRTYSANTKHVTVERPIIMEHLYDTMLSHSKSYVLV